MKNTDPRESFSTALISWYLLNRRDLPWRKNPTAYRVFMSEVMLQQTQASRVVPYYERWMKKFQDYSMVASACMDTLLLMWEGLGYYSRLHSLVNACKHIVKNHRGIFPSDYQEAISLPGVGPYTAGAVLSIAYNLPYPALDVNVKRVLARYCDIDAPVDRGPDALYRNKVLFFMPPGKAGTFNQSVMELGALCCLPRSPRCSECPVKGDCLALSRGSLEHRPRRVNRIHPRKRKILVAVILQNGNVFLRRRLKGGLWPGMWEFPHWEWDEDSGDEAVALQNFIFREHGMKPVFRNLLPSITCSYSGIRAIMVPFVFTLNTSQEIRGKDVYWSERSEIINMPIPSTHRKIADIVSFAR